MARSVESGNRLDSVVPVLNQESLLYVQKDIYNIYIKESIYKYILELITATRKHPCLERGVSPRGTIALVKMAKAMAWLGGKKLRDTGRCTESVSVRGLAPDYVECGGNVSVPSVNASGPN